MATEDMRDTAEESRSYAAEGTTELLLQQHRALLLGGTISDATFRAISVILTVLVLIAHYDLFLPVAVIFVGALGCSIWNSERRSLTARMFAVERALGKRNLLQYEDAFVAYRFAASSTAGVFRLLRFEPALWLVAIAALSVVRIMLKK